MSVRLQLVLFISPTSVTSRMSRQALERIIEQYPGEVDLEVVDVTLAPGRAERDKVLATPTLLRVHPGRPVRLIGDLSTGSDRVAELVFGIPLAPTSEGS